mgnify:CR=1 FL=1
MERVWIMASNRVYAATAWMTRTLLDVRDRVQGFADKNPAKFAVLATLGAAAFPLAQRYLSKFGVSPEVGLDSVDMPTGVSTTFAEVPVQTVDLAERRFDVDISTQRTAVDLGERRFEVNVDTPARHVVDLVENRQVVTLDENRWVVDEVSR